MIIKVYAIKDELTGFKFPIQGTRDGDIKRMFILETQNKDSLLNKCRQDFSIWRIGEYDTDKGKFKNTEHELIERGVNIADAE